MDERTHAQKQTSTRRAVAAKYTFVGRPASRSRSPPAANHGHEAQKLLGTTDRIGWDMLEWANAVLMGRKGDRRVECPGINSDSVGNDNDPDSGSGRGIGGAGGSRSNSSSSHNSSSSSSSSGSNGRGSSLSYAASGRPPLQLEFTRLESLDVGHLRRLADHVLLRLKASEASSGVARCSPRDHAQGRSCPTGLLPCGAIVDRHTDTFFSRDWRRYDGNANGSNGGGNGSDGAGCGPVNFRVLPRGEGLSLRETKLWNALEKLRDIPPQASLATFPDSLDVRTMKAMLEGGEPPLRASVVRFLMECDQAIAMRDKGYVNPLFAHASFVPSSTLDASVPGVSSLERYPLPDSSLDGSLTDPAPAAAGDGELLRDHHDGSRASNGCVAPSPPLSTDARKAVAALEALAGPRGTRPSSEAEAAAAAEAETGATAGTGDTRKGSGAELGERQEPKPGAEDRGYASPLLSMSSLPKTLREVVSSRTASRPWKSSSNSARTAATRAGTNQRATPARGLASDIPASASHGVKRHTVRQPLAARADATPRVEAQARQEGGKEDKDEYPARSLVFSSRMRLSTPTPSEPSTQPQEAAANAAPSPRTRRSSMGARASPALGGDRGNVGAAPTAASAAVRRRSEGLYPLSSAASVQANTLATTRQPPAALSATTATAMATAMATASAARFASGAFRMRAVSDEAESVDYISLSPRSEPSSVLSWLSSPDTSDDDEWPAKSNATTPSPGNSVRPARQDDRAGALSPRKQSSTGRTYGPAALGRLRTRGDLLFQTRAARAPRLRAADASGAADGPPPQQALSEVPPLGVQQRTGASLPEGVSDAECEPVISSAEVTPTGGDAGEFLGRSGMSDSRQGRVVQARDGAAAANTNTNTGGVRLARRMWERRAEEETGAKETSAAADSVNGRSRRAEREARRPSAERRGLAVGNIAAMFEEKVERAQRDRQDGKHGRRSRQKDTVAALGPPLRRGSLRRASSIADVYRAEIARPREPVRAASTRANSSKSFEWQTARDDTSASADAAATAIVASPEAVERLGGVAASRYERAVSSDNDGAKGSGSHRGDEVGPRQEIPSPQADSADLGVVDASDTSTRPPEIATEKTGAGPVSGQAFVRASLAARSDAIKANAPTQASPSTSPIVASENAPLSTTDAAPEQVAGPLRRGAVDVDRAALASVAGRTTGVNESVNVPEVEGPENAVTDSTADALAAALGRQVSPGSSQEGSRVRARETGSVTPGDTAAYPAAKCMIDVVQSAEAVIPQGRETNLRGNPGANGQEGARQHAANADALRRPVGASEDGGTLHPHRHDAVVPAPNNSVSSEHPNPRADTSRGGSSSEVEKAAKTSPLAEALRFEVPGSIPAGAKRGAGKDSKQSGETIACKSDTGVDHSTANKKASAPNAMDPGDPSAPPIRRAGLPVPQPRPGDVLPPTIVKDVPVVADAGAHTHAPRTSGADGKKGLTTETAAAATAAAIAACCSSPSAGRSDAGTPLEELLRLEENVTPADASDGPPTSVATLPAVTGALDGVAIENELPSMSAASKAETSSVSTASPPLMEKLCYGKAPEAFPGPSDTPQGSPTKSAPVLAVAAADTCSTGDARVSVFAPRKHSETPGGVFLASTAGGTLREPAHDEPGRDRESNLMPDDVVAPSPCSRRPRSPDRVDRQRDKAVATPPKHQAAIEVDSPQPAQSFFDKRGAARVPGGLQSSPFSAANPTSADGFGVPRSAVSAAVAAAPSAAARGAQTRAKLLSLKSFYSEPVTTENGNANGGSHADQFPPPGSSRAPSELDIMVRAGDVALAAGRAVLDAARDPSPPRGLAISPQRLRPHLETPAASSSSKVANGRGHRPPPPPILKFTGALAAHNGAAALSSGGGGGGGGSLAESPRRRASLSPGPRQHASSPGQRCFASPGPHRAEQFSAGPSPAGSDGGTRSRGFAALQAAVRTQLPASDGVHDIARTSSPGGSVNAAAVAKATAARPGVCETSATSPEGDGSHRMPRSDALAVRGGDAGRSDDDHDEGNSEGARAPPSGGDGGGGGGGSSRSSEVRTLFGRELPSFLAELVLMTGSLRSLVACQVVNRACRRSLEGERGQDLFGTIVRASGVPAKMRPALWQTLVFRAVPDERRGSVTGNDGLSPTTKGGFGSARSFASLVEEGKGGPHAALIARDVPRAFGAVAPHKRRDRGAERSRSRRSTMGGESGGGGGGARCSFSPPRANDAEQQEGLVGTLANLFGGWRQDAATGARTPPSSGRSRRRRRTPTKHRRASSAAPIVLDRALGIGDDNDNDDDDDADDDGSPFFSWLNPGQRAGCSPLPRRGRDTFASSASPPPLDRRRGSGHGDGRRNSGTEDGFSLVPPPGSPFRDRVSSWARSSGHRSPARGASGTNGTPAASAVPALALGGDGDHDDDAVWCAEAEAAWEAVPVESKRQCLGNVLLAVAARFPDVGYCQGMDRLVIILMMFFFVSTEDIGRTLTASSAAATATAVSALTEHRGGERDRRSSGSRGKHARSTSPRITPPGGHDNANISAAEAGGAPTGSAVVADVVAAHPVAPPSPHTLGAVSGIRPEPGTFDSRRVKDAGNGSARTRVEGSGDADGKCGALALNELEPPTVSQPSLLLHAPAADGSSRTWLPSPARAGSDSVLLGERVYNVFAGLFDGFRLHDLYLPERGGVLVCAEVLSYLTKQRLPNLACHFEEIDFSLDMVAMGWFQTLFVYLHAMPRSTLRRIWDWWLSAGDFEVFFRVAMALLDLSEERLLQLDLDQTLGYFNSFPEPGILSAEKLLPKARAVRIDDGELMYLELQVRRRESLEVPSVTHLMLRPAL